MSRRVVDLADKNLEELGLPEAVRDELFGIRAALDAEYRERFLELAEAINRQAAALERIQTTLMILVDAMAPQLEGRAPVAFRVAEPGQDPDLATAMVTADPVGAGFTLSGADVARALQISEVDASYLIRGFKLRNDPELAVTVRQGKRKTLYNYHRKVVPRLRELILTPPSDVSLSKDAQRALIRVRRSLGVHDEDAEG